MYYLPGVVFGSEARAKQMYKYHRRTGYVIASLMLVTVLLGTQSTWMQQQLAMFWPWAIALFLAWVGLLSRVHLFKLGW